MKTLIAALAIALLATTGTALAADAPAKTAAPAAGQGRRRARAGEDRGAARPQHGVPRGPDQAQGHRRSARRRDHQGPALQGQERAPRPQDRAGERLQRDQGPGHREAGCREGGRAQEEEGRLLTKRSRGDAAPGSAPTMPAGDCGHFLRVAPEPHRELRQRRDAGGLGAVAPVLQPGEQLLARIGGALPQRVEFLAHRVDGRQRLALLHRRGDGRAVAFGQRVGAGGREPGLQAAQRRRRQRRRGTTAARSRSFSISAAQAVRRSWAYSAAIV